MIVHEVIHKMKWKTGRCGVMTIKIDLHKAYENMNSDFITKTLKLPGFDQMWVELVKNLFLLSLCQ